MFPGHTTIDARLNTGIDALLKDAGEDQVLDIVEAGDPVLRQPSQTYTGQLGRRTFHKLIQAMRATMLDAPGVGLAAPQIGIGLKLAVVEDHVRDDEDDPREIAEFPFHVIVNPRYEPIGDETRSFYEGCLSVDGFQAVRKRWLDITAYWLDEGGQQHSEKLHGWPARIFQHETDHLHGELYIDKAQIRSLSTGENLDEFWAFEATPKSAAEELGFTL